MAAGSLQCAKLFSVPRTNSIPGHRVARRPGGGGAASVTCSDRARRRMDVRSISRQVTSFDIADAAFRK
jgi:hypothetical protein